MTQKSQPPRVQVPVEAEARAKLQAYADARGASLAAICAEILANTAPIAQELAQALERAKEAPVRAMREVSDALDRQLADLDQHKLDLSPKDTDKKTG